MKALRIALAAIAAVLIVAVAGVAIFAATFDANRYKPEIVKLVHDKTGRTLAIDGPIGLALFPRLGVTLGRTSLSEPGSDRVFARIESARVALAVMPLLRRQAVVDRIELAGLDVELVKRKDGTTNFDDLLGEKRPAEAKPAPPAAPGAESGFAIDVSGVALDRARVGWRDEASGTRVEALGLALSTGRIASGEPGKVQMKTRIVGVQPKIAADVSANAGYRLDLATKAASVSGLVAAVKGDMPGLAGLDATLKGDATWDPAGKRVAFAGVDLDARYAGGRVHAKLADASSTGDSIELPGVTIELALRTDALGVTGKVQSPVRLALDAKRAEATKLAGDLVLSGASLPAAEMKLALAGAAGYDWGAGSAHTDLTARVDESTIKTKVDVADFAPLKLVFDVEADRLNLDRYRGAKPAAGGGAPGGGGAAKGAAPAAEKPIDLGALKTLDASGRVRIGSLVVANLKAQSVHASVKTAGGRLHVAPLTANLYQGTLNADLAVDANASSYAIHQRLAGVAIGPLLADAIAKDPLEGRADVTAELATRGATASALKQALGGTVQLAVRDGAIKGINIAEIARQARALRKGGIESMQAVKTEKTDFSELTASFAVRSGVAHNEDLSVKSPFVRVGGAGDIDIAHGTLQYVAKASVVATSTGQGGKDLAGARSLTIPVKVSGPFDAVRYEIDYKSMVADAAKEEVRKRVEDAVGKQLDERLKGRLGDQLRGIFGK